KFSDISSTELVCAGEADYHVFGVQGINLPFKTNFFKIQDNFSHILYHSVDGRKLMGYTINLHRGYCKTFQRRQQDSTKGVADGNPITRLEGAEFEFAQELIRFDEDYLIGPLKIENGHMRCNSIKRLFGIKLHDELHVDVFRNLFPFGRHNKRTFHAGLIPSKPIEALAARCQRIGDYRKGFGTFAYTNFITGLKQ